MLVLAILSIFAKCSDEEILPTAYREKVSIQTDSTENTARTMDQDSILSADCKECTYVVPAGVKVIDGKMLGLNPEVQ